MENKIKRSHFFIAILWAILCASCSFKKTPARGLDGYYESLRLKDGASALFDRTKLDVALGNQESINAYVRTLVKSPENLDALALGLASIRAKLKDRQKLSATSALIEETLLAALEAREQAGTDWWVWTKDAAPVSEASGDLLLSSSRSGISYLNEFSTLPESTFSHTMLIVTKNDQPWIIEATPEFGVAHHPLLPLDPMTSRTALYRLKPPLDSKMQSRKRAFDASVNRFIKNISHFKFNEEFDLTLGAKGFFYCAQVPLFIYGEAGLPVPYPESYWAPNRPVYSDVLSDNKHRAYPSDLELNPDFEVIRLAYHLPSIYSDRLNLAAARALVELAESDSDFKNSLNTIFKSDPHFWVDQAVKNKVLTPSNRDEILKQASLGGQKRLSERLFTMLYESILLNGIDPKAPELKMGLDSLKEQIKSILKSRILK